MTVPPVNGLVLAGGRSSRMGRDKSTLVIHGKPQRRRLFDLLQRFCKEVYLSCKSDTGIPQSLNPIADRFQIDSPLNGILSAFTHEPAAAWLAVAVDMPLVDTSTIETLIRYRDPGKVATCFLDSDGSKPEPLLTLWEPQAFPLLRAFFESGHVSPRQFLLENNISMLTAPDRRALTNVNSEEDLRRLEGGGIGV